MNTNPTERPAWRVTAFVCECERIGLHALRTDGSHSRTDVNLAERVGEDLAWPSARGRNGDA
jgi:hypothetical protein